MTSEPQRPPTPSGVPVLGNAIGFARDPFGFVNRAIDECGDFYRMVLPTTEVYVMAHPEYFERVLVSDVDAFEKTADFRTAFGEGVIATEGDQWSRQRDVLNPLFRRDRIRDYGDYMVDATRRRLDAWTDGEVLDVESEMQNLTLEILFATLLGRELPPGEGEELRRASDGLNDWFTSTSWLLPNWVPTPSRRRFSASKERLRAEIQRLLAERGDAASAASRPGDFERETLLSKLHEARGDHLTTEEAEGQMLTMLFAGYETTAAALSFAWYLLATNPDVRRAFHDELDSVLDGRQPTKDDVEDLELTDRIVTETLRLYPPVHTLPRRTTRGVEVGGYRVPADTEVHLSVLSVHRDGRFYDDPLSFRPDRWESASGSVFADDAFSPFGDGHRTCVGRAFARLEATLVLATVGQRWALDWAGGDEDVRVEPELTIQSRDGIPLRLRAR